MGVPQKEEDELKSFVEERGDVRAVDAIAKFYRDCDMRRVFEDACEEQ